MGINARILIASSCVLLAVFASCQPQESAVTGTPVAKYGSKTLTQEEVDRFIPAGLAQADSQAQAQRFIQAWFKQQAIMELALKEVSGLEEQLDMEAAAHRRALAGYYYGEYLAENKLDTKVSNAEIMEYFRRHGDKFMAEDNYYAYYHVRLEKRPPNQQVALMRSSDKSDIDSLRVWAAKEALSFKLDSTYLKEGSLASIVEGTYLRPQSLRIDRTQTFRTREESKEFHHILKLIAKVEKGNTLPISLCKTQIEEIILTQRKQQLIEQAEAKRLQQAKNEGKAKVL